MHQPEPYGLAVYGGDLTDKDRLFIQQLTVKVLNFKDASSLDSLRYTRNLPDGGFAIVQHAGGIFRVIAYKEMDQEEKITEGTASSDIPMLFSGVILDGKSKNLGPIKLAVTDVCRRRLANYQGQVAKTLSLQRFAIKINPLFGELLPEIAGMISEDSLMFTQYTGQYPTWYSSAMAEVMQIAGGYGKQIINELPEEEREQGKLKLPQKLHEQISGKLDGVRLPAYKGMPPETGQFQFSYTFYKTHLVSFDAENKPWLIQIEPNAVWAMPLPIIPATAFPEFGDFMHEVGDGEIELLIERFGAMPSGEGFPLSPSLFQSWVRAGVIIKVCSTSDFYEHSAYSSACGWSANSTGNSAYNTCYDYVDDYCYGFTYSLALELGRTVNNGWSSKKDLGSLNSIDASRIVNYVGALGRYMREQNDMRYACIMYKLRRAEPVEVLARSSNPSNDSEISYWDNLVQEPIAVHRGHVACTNKGPLYSGTRIKLPEPFLKGCVSMDFTPMKQLPHQYPPLDTIIYTYYIGDDLKVIKNFYDESKFIKEVEGNFDDYMIVGAWEQIERTGDAQIQGEYYSTDFDDRKAIAPVEKTTKIVGKDLGYGVPRARYHFYFWTDGILTRDRYYTHKTNTFQSNGGWVQVSFIVNYYNRNMCTYFKTEGVTDSITGEKLELLSVRDPNSYYFWTYDWSWHNFDLGGKKTAKPRPIDSYPIWAEEHYYQRDGERSDFADEGDWIGGLPADVTDYVKTTTLIEYGGTPPKVKEYETEFSEGAKTEYACKLSYAAKAVNLSQQKQSDFIYERSPDQFGNVLFQDGCRVVFGTSEYANISITGVKERYRLGYSKLADHKTAHFFIGVINE